MAELGAAAGWSGPSSFLGFLLSLNKSLEAVGTKLVSNLSNFRNFRRSPPELLGVTELYASLSDKL